jgi:hypothetical protein
MPRPRPTLEPPRKAEPKEPQRPFPTGPLLALAILVVFVLGLYYSDAPPRVLQTRQAALAFLAAPDELLRMWCGGRIADFSLLDRWPIVVLAAVILAAAWLAGRLLIAALRLEQVLDRLEQFVFAIAAGLNLVSLYALAVGLAGLLQQRWVFVVPLVVLVVVNAWLAYVQRRGTPRRAFPTAPATPRRAFPTAPATPRRAFPTAHPGGLVGANDPRWYWLLVAAAPFAAACVLGGMIPPFAYDVREYHLQAPKEWFQAGRIDFLPHNIYANMPLGAELNSVWAMSLAGDWWWGAMAGKTVMACYPLVTAAALVALGRRVHSLAAGCVAAAVFLSVPWTVVLAVTGYNEAGVMLYALLAIFALWLGSRSEYAGESWRLCGLAGFLAGSAVACKYPPALFLVVPLLVWTAASALMPKPNWRRAAFAAAVFVAAAVAGCGLWLGKNWIQTGNPVYPLLYSAFDGRTRTPQKDRQWTKAHSPQPDEHGNRFSLSGLAAQVAWNGWRTLLAGSVLLPLAAMALLAHERRGLISALGLWMLFVFLMWWLFTHRLDRFLLLLLPALALLAGIGAAAIDHPVWRMSTQAVVVFGLVTQFPFATLPLDDNRFFAPLAELRRDEPRLTESVGPRMHPAHQWLNEHARPGERVLLVGDAEPFELQIPAVYNTCFDDCQFERLFKGHARDKRLAALRRENIRYVLFHWAHLDRYRSPGNYGYTSDYVSRELVHDELIGEQKLLVPIRLEVPTELAELYEVASQ